MPLPLFTRNPRFFFDILYIHHKVSVGGGSAAESGDGRAERCQQIFENLASLQTASPEDPGGQAEAPGGDRGAENAFHSSVASFAREELCDCSANGLLASTSSDRDTGGTREAADSVSAVADDKDQSVLCNNNFIFETHPSQIKLFTIMCLLLAHPVQRDAQDELGQRLDCSSW